MISRGIVKNSDEGKKTRTLQLTLMADEVRSDIEHPQEYGFSSAPLEGAEAIAIFMGGNRDHGSVTHVFDKRYRPTDLEPGEVCLFDDLGTKIKLKRGNKIEITASTDVKIISPKVIMTGDLEVDGNIIDNKPSNNNTVKDMRDIYNGHTHPETGSITTAPIEAM